MDIHPDTELIKNIVNKIFSHRPLRNGSDPDNIYIDLDSCLSIITSKSLPQDNYNKTIIIKNTLVTIAEFLEDWKNIARVKVFYSLKPSTLLNKYIPEWCSERNKTLEDKGTIYILNKNIINKIKNVADKISNIDMVETNDSTILYISKEIYLTTKTGKYSLVFSRNVHYQCLFSFLPDLEVFNGKNLISKNDFRITKGYPSVNYLLVPYYYALVGIPRNDFKGLNKWGPYKAVTYITANADKIIKNEDITFKDLNNIVTAMKIKPLFDKI